MHPSSSRPAANPTWSQAEVDPWADSKHRFSLKITRILDARESAPVKISALFRQIRCPILLLTADPAQGAILSDKDADELQQWIPHIQRKHVPGAGHNIRRDQYPVYMQAIQAFLCRESP